MTQLPNRGIIQKTDHFRSRGMMEIVREFPCGNCGAEDGTVVGAHPNASWAGKGKSIKAHDLVAGLCFTCHSALDQGSQMTRAEREEFWLKAFYQTMLYGFANRHFILQR